MSLDGYNAYQTDELAALYDAFCTYDDDIVFWQEMAVAAGGGPILELGCGTGRVLLPLAQAGHDVTGLDSSKDMLERCAIKLDTGSDTQRGHMDLIVADMTTFSLGRQYNAVFCAFNSFHHLNSAESQLECLERCHTHLVPNGMLVLDLFNPDPVPDPDTSVAKSGGTSDLQVAELPDGRSARRWLSSCEYDRASQTNECEMTYEIMEPDGSVRQLRESFPMRIIFRYELEHLLARCGFRLLGLYGGYDRSQLSDDSIGMIAISYRLD